MGWLILILMALAALLLLWRLAGLRGPALQLSAAALLLGMAGYGWQGIPGLPGKPAPPPIEAKQPDSNFALERAKLLGSFGSDAQILDAADAMHRAGLEAYAVGLIRGGIEKHPNSPDLWLGLGNALTLYAQGVITPAAKLAFERAAQLGPDHPGPPYFMGLAYAQAGQLERARTVWTELLARTPVDAPWRADLADKLTALSQAEGR